MWGQRSSRGQWPLFQIFAKTVTVSTYLMYVQARLVVPEPLVRLGFTPTLNSNFVTRFLYSLAWKIGILMCSIITSSEVSFWVTLLHVGFLICTENYINRSWVKANMLNEVWTNRSQHHMFCVQHLWTRNWSAVNIVLGLYNRKCTQNVWFQVGSAHCTSGPIKKRMWTQSHRVYICAQKDCTIEHDCINITAKWKNSAGCIVFYFACLALLCVSIGIVCCQATEGWWWYNYQWPLNSYQLCNLGSQNMAQLKHVRPIQWVFSFAEHWTFLQNS